MSDDGADDSVAGCTSASTRTGTSISDDISTRDDVHGHGGGRYARVLDPETGEGEGEDKDVDKGVQSRVPWRRYLRRSSSSSSSSSGSRDLGWELQSLDDSRLHQSKLSSRETKTGWSGACGSRTEEPN